MSCAEMRWWQLITLQFSGTPLEDLYDWNYTRLEVETLIDVSCAVLEDRENGTDFLINENPAFSPPVAGRSRFARQSSSGTSAHSSRRS